MLIRGLIYFCKNILFFFIILFTIFNLFHLHAETVIKLPEHHNQDGTFKNTNGFSNDRSFREMLKWNRERKNINVEPIQFPTKEPDFKIINDYKSHLSVTWIGHASFLYQNKDINILLDPHFTERASPLSFVGPKRYMPAGMKLEKLPKIDVVAISHNHYDHLDYKTVKFLSDRSSETIFLVPLGLKQWFNKNNIMNVRELDWWGTIEISNTKIVFVPVQHWSARGIFDRNESLWGGWHFKNSYHSFIHLGDTGYTDDFKEIEKKLESVDLAAIPIGAYEPRWFMKFSHMNPAEAVQAFIDLKAKRAIGMHWGTFILTDEPVDEPINRLDEEKLKLGIQKDSFFTLLHGETLLLE